MKPIEIMKIRPLFILLFLVTALGFSCQQVSAQGRSTYRMFDWELTKILMTVTIDGNQIEVSGYHVMGQPYQIEKALLPTSAPDLFYFDGSVMHLVTSESKAPFRLVYLDRSSKKLELYGDTAFADQRAVEQFISNRKNLITSFAYLLTSDLELKEAQAFPALKTISKADQERYRRVDKKRYQELSSLDLNGLSTDQKVVMMVKQTNLIYRNCLLIGYRPPIDQSEFSFLKQLTYQEP
ncbi:hypothetical protein PBAL39_21050 [Pedobacter sp. BAL39]|uniref:hypothetical protein n=1 Tax=Pedobacter sp. BAL39 TaxID=391596 RepID=UPI0001559889|nr:hypothetical protein [Pedobacter sp. BAL39]EDM38601.1 hypothetical protein PBAL39_21050 [Pedobacter sp. BAL39]